MVRHSIQMMVIFSSGRFTCYFISHLISTVAMKTLVSFTQWSTKISSFGNNCVFLLATLYLFFIGTSSKISALQTWAQHTTLTCGQRLSVWPPCFFDGNKQCQQWLQSSLTMGFCTVPLMTERGEWRDPECAEPARDHLWAVRPGTGPGVRSQAAGGEEQHPRTPCNQELLHK